MNPGSAILVKSRPKINGSEFNFVAKIIIKLC